MSDTAYACLVQIPVDHLVSTESLQIGPDEDGDVLDDENTKTAQREGLIEVAVQQ